MSTWVREGQFDLIVAAGPAMAFWPTVGVQTLSSMCAEFDLKVGVFGGEDVRVVGALPLQDTGAIVIVQDTQNRIHRLQTRALVRVLPRRQWPDPFKNWRSPALIPLSTAKKIKVNWSPCTVILGSGNAALRMGSLLLEQGVREVYCVESHGKWGNKAYAGWEVEKRRFEVLGGKLIYGHPVSIEPKSAMLWELRVQDSGGVRIIETAWVISAGPFDAIPTVREHPDGSLLHDFENTAGLTLEEDVEGWTSEQYRAEALAVKLVRNLKSELTRDEREHLEKLLKRSKMRTRKIDQHQDGAFSLFYQGKWAAALSAQQIRSFSGVPKKSELIKKVASIECFENIACQICEKSCPESAIEWNSARDGVLTEDKCTGCGACLKACPSGAISMMQEQPGRSTVRQVFPFRASLMGIQVGGFVQLLNRRGEYLANGRVMEITLPENPTAKNGVILVDVEVPAHLLWEARGVRRIPAPASQDTMMDAMSIPPGERVEVTLMGEKRLVRDGAVLGEILFETGRARAEDALMCSDGSCGLCEAEIDGVRKLTCKTQVHRGMVVKKNSRWGGLSQTESGSLVVCACLNMTIDELVQRVKQGGLSSADAITLATGIGAGKCHGQLCLGTVRRVLQREGIQEMPDWVDWRFPWADWILVPSST